VTSPGRQRSPGPKKKLPNATAVSSTKSATRRESATGLDSSKRSDRPCSLDDGRMSVSYGAKYEREMETTGGRPCWRQWSSGAQSGSFPITRIHFTSPLRRVTYSSPFSLSPCLVLPKGFHAGSFSLLVGFVPVLCSWHGTLHRVQSGALTESPNFLLLFFIAPAAATGHSGA